MRMYEYIKSIEEWCVKSYIANQGKYNYYVVGDVAEKQWYELETFSDINGFDHPQDMILQFGWITEISPSYDSSDYSTFTEKFELEVMDKL